MDNIDINITPIIREVTIEVSQAVKGENGTNGIDGVDGVVQSIVGGTNVTIDNTDVANPIINVDIVIDETSISDGSITLAKLADRLKKRVDLANTTVINFSAGSTFLHNTLTADTEFTFTNLPTGTDTEVKTLEDITGEFAITLPAYCEKYGGTYDGTKKNQFVFQVVNGTSGSEFVKYSINTSD